MQYCGFGLSSSTSLWKSTIPTLLYPGWRRLIPGIMLTIMITRLLLFLKETLFSFLNVLLAKGMTQISTIKPVDVTKPKVKPQFTFDDNAYQSYIQEGLKYRIEPQAGMKGNSSPGST